VLNIVKKDERSLRSLILASVNEIINNKLQKKHCKYIPKLPQDAGISKMINDEILGIRLIT